MLAPDTVLQHRYRIIRQLGKGGMGAGPKLRRVGRAPLQFWRFVP